MLLKYFKNLFSKRKRDDDLTIKTGLPPFRILYTSKNIVEYDFYLNAKDRALAAENPGIRYALIEVLKISESVGHSIHKERTILHLHMFYSKNSRALDTLLKAPFQTQLQFISSIDNCDSFSNTLAFMMVASQLDFKSVLFDSNSKVKVLMTGDKNNCMIRLPLIDKSSRVSDEVLARVRSVKLLSYSFLMANFAKKLDLIDLEDDLENNLFLERYENMGLISNAPAIVSAFYLLCETYQVSEITEVLYKFSEVEKKPSIIEVLYLLEDWDTLKNYPLEWSLEISMANQ